MAFDARRPPLPYLLVLAAATCCYGSLGAIVSVLPGYLLSGLHRSALAVGLGVAAPALTAVVARPVCGRLADERGPRAVLAGGALAIAAATAAMLGRSYGIVLVSRLLAGMGEGAVATAAMLWLLRLADPRRRGRAVGHSGLALFGGLTAGSLLAGALGGDGALGRVVAAATALPLLALMVPAGTAPGAPAGAIPNRRGALPAVARATLRPAVGLILVNVAYAALLAFGGAAAGPHAGALLPVYAVMVIAVRATCGGLPDRLGPGPTLGLATPTAALGLTLVALAPGAGALAGSAVLGVGQALIVPALGLLAIRDVAPADHGVASGTFLAGFDVGVGLGGPLAGAIATLGGPSAALLAGAAAVALACPAAVARRPLRR